ncbi:MAG: hypothetical protein COB78_10700 [Hyphomicrobiales bacterium]|nr:MAG: hypothetical protein COB78_10700 [Hyphomicrobiales bacterium]
MPKEQHRRRDYRNAVRLMVIGAFLFLFGLALYFQPVGEELFTVMVRFPVVEVNLAPAMLMMAGALCWMIGGSSRSEVIKARISHRQKLQDKLDVLQRKNMLDEAFQETNKEAQQRHLTSLAYAGVLVLLLIAAVLDVMTKGFLFKHILMYSAVMMTVGVKFAIHVVHNR